MDVIDSSLVFDARSAPAHQRASFFLTMLRLSSGRILTGFRRGSTKESADGDCCLAESADGGLNWRIVCEGFRRPDKDRAVEVRSVSLAETRDGTLRAFLLCLDRSGGNGLYDAESDTVSPTSIRTMRSSDGGRTWRSETPLDMGPWRHAVLSGPAVAIPGGRWLVTLEKQEPEAAGGPSVHSAEAAVVGDEGELERIVRVARDPNDRLFYYDQRQAFCPKTNRLISAFWTYDRAAEKDVDIHLSQGDPAALEWQAPAPTDITGQIAQPIPLPDGRLLLFYVDRTPPGSMRLIASEDSGSTWQRSSELVVYRHGGAQQGGAEGVGGYASLWDDIAKWSFGHPAAVVLDEGTVLLTYYAGPDERCLSIHWAMIRL